jgi:hypothetical protein
MENIPHLEGEIWQDVKGSEGFYKVSNMGRIYSYKSNRLIGSKGGGRLNHRYWLANVGTNNTTSIHRLVALYFVFNDDPINKTDVDHINFDIDDNRAVNLRWVTKSENQLHSGKRLAEKRRGNLHWKKILTDEQCKEIFKLREQKIKYKDIANMYGVKENTVCSMVLRGRNHIKNIE